MKSLATKKKCLMILGKLLDFLNLQKEVKHSKINQGPLQRTEEE
jgi:hypothetical protein